MAIAARRGTSRLTPAALSVRLLMHQRKRLRSIFDDEARLHRGAARVGLGILLAVGPVCKVLLPVSHFDTAVRAFRHGDYAAAIDRLDEAIQRGRDSARVRTLLGWSRYKTGELPRARAEFERSLRMDANDANAFYAKEGLGWIAYTAGDYETAIGAFRDALRRNPGYHNAHVGLGWSYRARGDLAQSETNFEAALKTAPDDLDALRGLGFVAYDRGDWARAIECLREVVRRSDGDTLDRIVLGWAHYRNGDLAAARMTFNEVTRREPSSASALAGLAWVAEREGRWADAKAGFQAAIEKSAAHMATPDFRALLADRPEWIDLWRDLGWALYRQRALPAAEAEFRALLDRYPNDRDARRGLASAREAP